MKSLRYDNETGNIHCGDPGLLRKGSNPPKENIVVLNETEVINSLILWGEKQSSVRAMILTSSRTNPHAYTDIFSDYDIILVVTDIHPFWADRTWLEDFSRVLVAYRDPIQPDTDFGMDTFAWIVQYENWIKIDYCFMPVELIRKFAEHPELAHDMRADLDLGYRILLDKDNLTDGLMPPTYRAYIPVPPPQGEYLRIIEEFFHEATYVAKHLWRDDLLPAKYNLDYAMKHVNLRRMLEWRMEMDHNWSVKTGAYGKGLKKRLDPQIWAGLEDTYVGADIDENWEAMFRTIDLFRSVAIEVGDHLGYSYPHDLHRRAVAYLTAVRNAK
jgi:aminoglycoside 6-adenylyltransferase